MLSFLSTLQFAQPWLLAGLLLTPALILAYLHRNPTKRKIVSSLIVLKSLTLKPAPRRKFKPPLRFFLELLALAALCAAAARPVTLSDQYRIALVIDNSLSMRALETTGGLPGTRLERAKAAARKWLDEQSSRTAVDLFSSSPKVSRLGPERREIADAQAALSEMKASAAGDNLEAAVQELAESGIYERVVAVTDKTVEYVEGGRGDPISLFGGDEQRVRKQTRVVGVTVGERDANLWVSGFAMVQSGLSGGGTKLIATIGYAGPAPTEAKVVFTRLGEREDVIEAAMISLQPGQTTEARADLPPDASAGQAYRVEVTPKTTSPIKDALAEDNSAWLVPRSDVGTRILLVSPAGALSKSGLEMIPGFEIEMISPEEFSDRAAAGLDKYSIIIFHRSAPSVPPKRSTLLVLPPADNNLFPVAAQANTSFVSSWVTEHPITSYLKVPLLHPGEAEIFAVPPWAQSVIRAERGTITAAGESHGYRFAAVGFEILPFEGARTSTVSVLTLNLINWLSGGAELTGSTLSGSAIRSDGPGTWTVMTPEGRTETVNGETFTLPLPGLYQVNDAGGGHRVIAANAFYPEESNTYSAQSFSAKRSVEHEKKIDEGAQSWWPMLVAIALSLMILEQLISFLPERKKA